MALAQVTQTISTLGNGLSWMARYAGGSVPGVNDTQYAEWISWQNEGQEDAAERGFWARLLTKTTLSIVADTDSADLPADFHKRNGIYVLKVGEVDWNAAHNADGQMLLVTKKSTGGWQVTFTGYTPTANATATLWYFRHPGKMTAEADSFLLDGKMCSYYALAEYFRQAGELGSLDDARAEYDNRFRENLSNEVLPSPQELMGWTPYYKHLNQNWNERAYYSRGRRAR